jgi:hypothetical protein
LLGEDTKRAFVAEVERMAPDPVYFVRREAAFALGALAKVVPEEVVLLSLASTWSCFVEETALIFCRSTDLASHL